MMMKKIYGTITILILAAAVIALAACANILDSPQPKREAGTGTVYIVIGGDSAGDRATARTLAPDPAKFIRYTASFSGPEPQADREITGGSAWVDLVPGEWTITVTAFTGADAAAGRGSVMKTVVSGQTAAVDITITPITGDGRSGSFRYSVTIPAVDSATLSLTGMPANTAVSGTPVNLKTAADSSGGIAAAALNLDAGYYLVNIQLEQDGRYAGRTEVVHIYDGLETAAAYAFTGNDFGVVLGDLTDGVWQGGEITVNGPEHYRFPVTAGKTYFVSWNDKYEGDSTKTLDIKVSAYYETGGSAIFSNRGGYNTPVEVFAAASSGSVIFRVERYSSGYTTGTYSIRLVSDATASVRVIPRGEQNTYVGGYGIQYSAQALRSDGSVREGVSFTFTYGGGADPSTGLFTPATAGTYHVTASADGKSGTSDTLTVHPADYLRRPYYYPGTGATYTGYAGTEGTHTTSGGVTVTYPSATTFNANGFFTLEGTVNNSAVYNYAYVAVYKGIDTSNSNVLQTYYLVRDTFKTRIWLRFGSGQYTIQVHGLSSINLSPGLGAEGDYTGGARNTSPITFTVTNTANDGVGVDGTTPDRRFIYPSYLMQSDDFRVTNTVYDNDSVDDVSMRKKQDALTVLGKRYTITAKYPDGPYLAVCEGYAHASGALIRAAGIETKFQSSEPMNHAWNQIYVNGGWKLYDATWDDQEMWGISYEYFMVGLTGVNGDHYGDTTDMRRSVLPIPALPRQKGVPDGWY
jgi:hypothetical protein